MGEARAAHCTSILAQRLNECLPQIHQIREICKVPSITFGVVHQGQVVFKESIGHRDVEGKLQPDADTIYMIGSCSKMFTAAAVGILVEEGMLSWQDPIQKHLPGFDPKVDPRIGQEADIIDCLRHSTGLTAPDMLVFGAQGSILTDEEDLIPILNMMPTSDKKGQRFNREWNYNNLMVGLVALVVQKVSGQRFADFVRERILEPLSMNRTVVSRSEIEKDDNVAIPCRTLREGRFAEAKNQEYPCEDYTPLLAATGMRSSLNDMLNWCITILDAEQRESESENGNGQDHAKKTISPLKQVKRVRRGYWTRPVDDPEFSKPATYGIGWVQMQLPSSMFGALSGNSLSRDKDYGKTHLQYILGKDAEPFQMIGHTGGMNGSIFSIFTFPETQSAVVTMTNGRDLGDASDFTAQILTQALFDLKPSVDLTPWAKMEAGLRPSYLENTIGRPWTENRRPSDPERDIALYLGRYCGFGDRFTLTVNTECATCHEMCNLDSKMSVVFNDRKLSKCPLVFYTEDVYSFFDTDEEVWKTRQIHPADYKQTLLKFKVNEGADKALGLWWQWDSDADPAWLDRIA